MAKDKRLFILIEGEKKARLKEKARAEGLDISKVVRRFLDAWLKGRIKLPQ